MVQLSGLLAVHGWFVSCGEEKQNTRADKNSDVFAVFISEVSAPTL